MSDTKNATELKPSVLQALEVGEGCGLLTLKEAVGNYLNHYTMFFLIAKYAEQYTSFVDELKSLGFILDKELIDISIADAIKVCKTQGDENV